MESDMFRLRALILVSCCVLSFPGIVRAQDGTLARVLVDFLQDGVRMRSGAAGTAGNPHEVHFLPGLNLQVAPFQMNKALINQLSTFPIGTSSGGFTYTLDSSTGAITARSDSFGPSFAERPLTIGRGKVSAGVHYQHVKYNSFEGADLDAGEIIFLLPHNDCCPAGVGVTTNVGDSTPPFEGDLIEARLNFNLKTDTTVAFANFGVSNNVDIGVAVPFVRNDLRVGGRFTILRLATAATPIVHSWDGAGATVKDVPLTGGSASGIGDILVRGKVAFVPGVLAAEVGFRLPTGDEADLLGTGGMQTRLMLIAGSSSGAFSPHVNIGYVFSHGSLDRDLFAIHPPTEEPASAAIAGLQPIDIDLSRPDEFTYTGGFDWAATRRVTFAADLIGRTMRETTRFETSSSSFSYRTVAGAPLVTETRPQLNLASGSNLNLLIGAVGAKVNVATNLLLTGNLLFPLSDSGLRPGVTPVVGLDYAF
jgi:hypothetical protein